MPAVNVLYRDSQVVAVGKPAGLLVHRSDVDRRETLFLLQLVRDLTGRRVYPVHRLDRATSGVMLLAFSPEAAHRLGEAFAAGRVAKNYLAVARGVAAAEGVIDHPLAPLRDRSAAATGEPVPAVTAFRRLAWAELPAAVGRYPTARYSLVAATPRTGRRHQLRRHFKHIRHPLIGDTTYGEGRHNRFFREELDCGRLLLHAVELTVPHPEMGQELTVTAPLDGEFAALVDRLGWRGVLPAPWLPGAPSSVP